MILPRLLVTLGDVAGIGPEIVAKAWPLLTAHCRPTVIGDPARLPPGIPCVNPSPVDLSNVPLGQITAAGGRAAYDWLVHAIDECLAGRADGIVTCPLHKEGLHAAGIDFPGHTEILADRTGTKSYAMLLYDDELPLAVAHVTLHRSLKSIFDHVTTETVLDKIRLRAGQATYRHFELAPDNSIGTAGTVALSYDSSGYAVTQLQAANDNATTPQYKVA